jgi:hypothetical protein
VAADIDLLQLEGNLRACFVEHLAGLLAEVAALCVKEGDLMDKCRG